MCLQVSLRYKGHGRRNPTLAILLFVRRFLPHCRLAGNWTSGELNQLANDLIPLPTDPVTASHDAYLDRDISR